MADVQKLLNQHALAYMNALDQQANSKLATGSGKSPYIDPAKAKEIEKGATESGWNPTQWKKNLKSGLGLS